MKKLLAVLLALLLVVSFGACGKEEETGGADESWTKVESSGKLILGLDDAFPPMGYKDTQTGEIIGLDIDVAKVVCEKLGVELVLQPIDWDGKSKELKDGNIDCLWNGFSKTPERDEEFNLSMPYMKNNQIILVKTDSSYQSLADLSGKILGVQADSSAESALNGEENKEFKASLKEVVTIGDYAKAVLEIQNGTIDAIAIDEVVARFYLENDPGQYRILENADGTVVSLAVEDYVIGFRKEDTALKEKVEEALTALAKEGKLTEISKKWFGDDIITIGK